MIDFIDSRTLSSHHDYSIIEPKPLFSAYLIVLFIEVITLSGTASIFLNLRSIPLFIFKVAFTVFHLPLVYTQI